MVAPALPPTPLHRHLPYRPWSDPGMSRLPGVLPLGAAPWLLRDEVFAGQMALRDALLAGHRGQVLAELPEPEGGELLARVLAALEGDPGYCVRPGRVRRPDGVEVSLDGDSPAGLLARLVQEDLLLHRRDPPLPGDDPLAPSRWRLAGGTLLFPSSWTLGQKLGRDLGGIHAPVRAFADEMSLRVARMFDRLRPEAPLWRANWLLYRDPDLFQPRAEGQRKPPAGPEGFLRSERQTFLRLPESGAVVFGIHSFVLPRALFADELPPGPARP